MAAIDELTPERWEAARRVLHGECGAAVSKTAAAQAAGVSVGTLNAWIRRSQKGLIEDDPWVHQIWNDVNEAKGAQANTLEDVAWQRAVEGWDHPVIMAGKITDSYKKFDNKILMQLLAVRNEQYRTTRETRTIAIMDTDEVFERLQAAERLKLADQALDMEVEDIKISDDAEIMEELEKLRSKQA